MAYTNGREQSPTFVIHEYTPTSPLTTTIPIHPPTPIVLLRTLTLDYHLILMYV